MAGNTVTYINNGESFEAWLNTRHEITRQAEALTLAHRATLRILPMLDSIQKSDDFGPTALATFRCAITARTELISGSVPKELLYDLITMLHEKTANKIDQNLRTRDMAEVSSANRSFAYVIEELIGQRFSGGANVAINSAAGFFDYRTNNSEAVFWDALRSDADLFAAGGTIESILGSRLWQTEPSWWQEVLQDFSESLIAHGFFIWTEWFDAVAFGKPIFGIRSKTIRSELERKIALGSTEGEFDNEFWRHPIHDINDDIKHWVEDAYAADPELEHAIDYSAPTINDLSLKTEDFKSRPASVETTIKDGMVVLEQEKPQTDLPAVTAEAATADLAKALRQIAVEAAAAQADQRFVNFLHNAAEAIEKAVHNQEQLFESGRNQKALDAYSKIVDTEWNAILAAQYYGLVAQFSQTLNHFKAWHDFVANPVSTAEQFKPAELAATAENVVEGLTHHRAVFATLVLQKLQWLVVRFRQTVNALQVDDAAHPITTQVFEMLQNDLAISLSNTLLTYVQTGLIRFGGNIAEGVVSAADKVGNGVGYLAVLAMVGASIHVLQRQNPELYSTLVKAIKALRKVIKDTEPDQHSIKD